MSDFSLSNAPPPSFAMLAQRAEVHRVQIWAATLVGLLGLGIGRRALDGLVMGTNAVFWPSCAVLVASLLGQIWLWRLLYRADRAGRLLASPFVTIMPATDLAVPLALMVILAWYSPRGPLEAASAPALLLLPMLTLLSVLRLRPTYTLSMGLAGAVFHVGLVGHAMLEVRPPADQYLVYFSYSLVLALMALAGMRVTHHIRAFVRHVAEETHVRYQTDMALADVNRDLSVAREIQQGLLPLEAPNFPGFDIAGMNRPASQTGGDYYDWQWLPDGRLIVCLADVSGHGIGPALVMAVCRAYARASAELTADPSALMRRINRLLEQDLPDDRFITLEFTVLRQDGQMQLVSAGHGPTLLYVAATGKVQQLGSHGLPLGILLGEPSATDYEPATEFSLAEGDVLVMLTDGFHEWARSGDGVQVGIERLEAVLRGQAGQPAASIIAALDQVCIDFVDGQPQQDDMTAVVIRRLQSHP